MAELTAPGLRRRWILRALWVAMKLSLFDYELPEELIAQYPAEDRSSSRLLVVHGADDDGIDGRGDGADAVGVGVGDAEAADAADAASDGDDGEDRMEHRFFSDLPRYLRAGDLLVLNDSKVVKARLIGEKLGTGARIELFLLQGVSLDGSQSRGLAMGEDALLGSDGPADGGASLGFEAAGGGNALLCECLARPARRLKVGDEVYFGERLSAVIVGRSPGGTVLAEFRFDGIFMERLDELGHMPLPPYIRRPDEESDAERYQTVYAAAPGSAAAPTAGLHFTEELLSELRAGGVQTAFVTLHVGLGTFKPVQVDDIEEHRMHEEVYHISEEAAALINAASAEGRRVICVGTTSVRTIESAAFRTRDGCRVRAGEGETNIFIYPGGRGFCMTDAMITNFHLPKSTLLMLVSAFRGREKILRAYEEAVKERYRFFSYGDAMLLL
jgi:S-adenosylmethionine:tRNA ribosyltransferase-isomerase